LLLSGNFIKENGLLKPGSGSVEHTSRDTEPGAPVAVCQINARGPKLQRAPGNVPPTQPPPRTTPGMRMPDHPRR
jgi:hypothetical protein